MERHIRAIFFDLDGTLVTFNRPKYIPQSAQDALQRLRDNGVKLFIATGRPPIWAAMLKNQTDFQFDGQVMLNGQYCVDETGKPFYTNPLSTPDLKILLGWLEQHPDISCDFMEEDYVYQNSGDLRSATRSMDDPRRCLTHPTYQISPYVGPEYDAEILAQTPGFKSARWKAESTDLIPIDGGKPVGMARMLERFGIAREECMAIGDGLNDIEMLEFAGVGVAMGNGHEKLKEVADYVTTDIEDNGIANAMKYFGLI